MNVKTKIDSYPEKAGIYAKQIRALIYKTAELEGIDRIEENGIAPSSFTYWLNSFQSGRLSGMSKKDIPNNKSAEEKFKLLMQYLTQSEENRGVWLRENGLKDKHMTLWQLTLHLFYLRYPLFKILHNLQQS